MKMSDQISLLCGQSRPFFTLEFFPPRTDQVCVACPVLVFFFVRLYKIRALTISFLASPVLLCSILSPSASHGELVVLQRPGASSLPPSLRATTTSPPSCISPAQTPSSARSMLLFRCVLTTAVHSLSLSCAPQAAHKSGIQNILALRGGELYSLRLPEHYS